jgi:CDP-paratose 2-epimerase
VTGKTIPITAVPENRAADVPLYITDNARIERTLGWSPRRTMQGLVEDVHAWITSNEASLRPIVSGA